MDTLIAPNSEPFVLQMEGSGLISKALEILMIGTESIEIVPDPLLLKSIDYHVISLMMFWLVSF